MDIREQLLAQFPIFRTLPSGELDDALRGGHLRRLSAGDSPFRTNSPCMGFSMLVSGVIRVVKPGSGGREVELYRLQPGESCLISTSCMLGKVNYPATAVAASDVALFTIPPSIFKQLLGRHDPFRDFVFNQFSLRLADLMVLVEAIAFQRLDQRLAVLLLEQEGCIRASQAQIAERLGTVREIVGRLLKNFEQRGLVALGRGQIRVLDPDSLREVAERPA